MPAHHAPDDMLVAYAAGMLGESESLLLACHLTLCPRCRARVADAESLGAALLGEAEPAPVADGMLEAIWARVEGTAGPPHSIEGTAGPPHPIERTAGPPHSIEANPEPPAAEPPPRDPSGVVPAPLYSLIGELDTAPWRRVFPGIHMLSMPTPGDGLHMSMVRVRPGGRIPDHGHRGFEGTLVLAGGFTDDHGHFVRGDLALRDATTTHVQHIDRGEPCIWLLVSDGRPVPRTLGGWIIRILLGA